MAGNTVLQSAVGIARTVPCSAGLAQFLLWPLWQYRGGSAQPRIVPTCVTLPPNPEANSPSPTSLARPRWFFSATSKETLRRPGTAGLTSAPIPPQKAATPTPRVTLHLACLSSPLLNSLPHSPGLPHFQKAKKSLGGTGARKPGNPWCKFTSFSHRQLTEKPKRSSFSASSFPPAMRTTCPTLEGRCANCNQVPSEQIFLLEKNRGGETLISTP